MNRHPDRLVCQQMQMTPRIVHTAARFETASILDFEQPGGMRISRHAHENTTIFCALDGEATDHVGTRAYRMQRGSILLRPAGAEHDHEYATRLRAIAVEIDPSAAASLGVPAAAALAFAPPLVRSLHEELDTIDVLRPLAVAAAIAEIATHVGRHVEGSRNGAPEWLLRVRELLHEECAERLSLDRLSAAAGVHAGHVARTFRAHFGRSVAAYSRELRLRRAARALIKDADSIVAIALQFGFFDQSHFDRLFRRQFGATPSSFRAMFGISKSQR